MSSQQWTVKALVSYLKLKLDNDSLIQNITVTGELSNFNHHHTNHIYDAYPSNCCYFLNIFTSNLTFIITIHKEHLNT